jgi:capsid protein
MSNELHIGASDNRMFADWMAIIQEPTWVWAREWRKLAARAVSLVSNDPFAAAMVNAKLRETHGPKGLMLRSEYRETGGTITSPKERAKRREIECTIQLASAKRHLDAGGILTRREMELQLDWIATVMGDAWATWHWIPGRHGAPLAGCWRIVTPDRVSNPNWGQDTKNLKGGCKYENGQWVSIYVETFDPISCKSTWAEYPVFDPDTGMQTVVHHTGFRLPGMTRGISMFAPMLLTCRQTSETIVSVTSGNRAKAVHPIVYSTNDPAELAAAEKKKSLMGVNAVIGPMSILVKKFGDTEVEFLNPTFQGAELREYLRTLYANLSAVWGLPWQVVLCEMGEASLSSARAGLDQCKRSCDFHGTSFEDAVSRPMDENIVREAVARGALELDLSNIGAAMVGKYSRPPKYSTDLLKDANTVRIMVKEDGISPTTALEMVFGIDFEAQVEQTARDIEFALAQGLPDPTKSVQPTQVIQDKTSGNADQTTDPPPDQTAEDPPPKATLFRRIIGKFTGKSK